MKPSGTWGLNIALAMSLGGSGGGRLEKPSNLASNSDRKGDIASLGSIEAMIAVTILYHGGDWEREIDSDNISPNAKPI